MRSKSLRLQYCVENKFRSLDRLSAVWDLFRLEFSGLLEDCWGHFGRMSGHLVDCVSNRCGCFGGVAFEIVRGLCLDTIRLDRICLDIIVHYNKVVEHIRDLCFGACWL